MKKVICAVLIVLMLPLTCISLIGCKETKNIKDFVATYTKIADDTPNLELVEATDIYQASSNSVKIDIKYSLSSKLSTLVEDNSTPYYNLKYFYQKMLDDTLSPLYFFGQSISSSKKISDKQTNKLYQYLSELKEDYLDINYYTGTLITSLNATNNEKTNLSYLRKLFEQYEKALNSAGNLSSFVCDVYFNTVISNSNIDYSSKTYNQLTEGDLINITINTRSRIYYYKSIYANVYNQLHIKGGNFAETLIENPTIPDKYEPYDDISKITFITKKSTDKLNNNKQGIYNNVISLYNIQNNMDLAYKHFTTATNKITYLSLNEKSSTNNLNYGLIIKQFARGIAQDSYEILSNLLSLLYNY